MSPDGLKNPCYAGLTEQQQRAAKAADDLGNLDLLKLVCDSCGQAMGAKVTRVQIETLTDLSIESYTA